MFQGRSWKLLAALISTLLAYGAQADQQAVPGEYVVVLKKSNIIGTQAFQSVFRANGVETLNAKGDQLLIKRSPLERQDFVIADLESHSQVAYAEPNFIYTINATTPNDPMLDDLWGLINNGQKGGAAGVDIGAAEAWQITTGSRDIVVGVIDTGVDYTHPDLKNNMWVNEAEKNGEAGVDDDNNGYVDDIYGYDFANNDGDPIDDHDHGTHVSGTIGAEGNDGQGIVGVSWRVRIMALKFLTGSGSGSLAGALKAIDYATENGAHLTSNSWGGGGFSQALYDSIQRAKEKGLLFVAAAGNEGRDSDERPGYPAAYDLDNIISVAAVDRNGELASFSNFGRTSVDVGAPGVAVLSTTKDGQYKEFRGTSMACPHVSGVAALILSKYPDMDYSEVRDRIINTAVPMAALKNKVVSHGFVNAYSALTNELPPPDVNDPENWKNVEIFAETAHPYASSATQEWEFEQAGAKQVSIYFERFETERNYDKVQFYDRAGNLVETLSGTYNDTYGPNIPGDYVRVVFTSDQSVNRFGLVMKALAFQDDAE